MAAYHDHYKGFDIDIRIGETSSEWLVDVRVQDVRSGRAVICEQQSFKFAKEKPEAEIAEDAIVEMRAAIDYLRRAKEPTISDAPPAERQ